MAAKTNSFTVLISTIILVAFHFAGCGTNVSDPPPPSTITLSFESTPFAKRFKKVVSTGFSLQSTVDSLCITRVRFLLRNMKIRSLNDSLDFMPTVRMIDLNNNGRPMTLGSYSVQSKKYTAIDFILPKPPADAQTLPEYSDPALKEFTEASRYSVIVDGKVFTPTDSARFVWKCKEAISFAFAFLPALMLDQGETAQVVFGIQPLDWFKDSATGLFFDPTDISNEALILANVQNAIHKK